MLNQKNQCLKITMQGELEEPNTHDLEKKSIDALCNAFPFWYSMTKIDDYQFYVAIYILNDEVFLPDYKTIVKTFALMNSFSVLYSEFVDTPENDNICLKYD